MVPIAAQTTSIVATNENPASRNEPPMDREDAMPAFIRTGANRHVWLMALAKIFLFKQASAGITYLYGCFWSAWDETTA